MNKILILYASETGTSQDLAHLLAARLRRLTLSSSRYSHNNNNTNDNNTQNTINPIAQIIVSSLDDYLPKLVDLINGNEYINNNENKNKNPFILLLPLISTTGQGEMPQNAHKFWKFLLRKKLPSNLFSQQTINNRPSFQFSTFGLGDSSYPRFNWAVRKLHTRLLQLGAHELVESIPRAEADEQSSDPPTDRVYQEWEDLIVKYLESLPAYQDPETGVGLLNTIPDEIILPPITPTTISNTSLPIDDNNNHSQNDIISQSLTRIIKKHSGTSTSIINPSVSIANVTKMDRITSPSHFQDVRHIVLEVPIPNDDESSSNSYFSYKPGDTIALYPSNNPDDVSILLNHLGWTSVADNLVTVSPDFIQTVLSDYPNSSSIQLVQPLTLRNLLIYHLDIMTVPRRSFFNAIWRFAKEIPSSDDDDDDDSTISTKPTTTTTTTDRKFTAPDASREREKLREFCTAVDEDSLQDLYNYANRPRRSILETILEFKSLSNNSISPSYITDIFPILKPRLFSIASYCPQPLKNSNSNGSNDSNVRKFELCIAMVKYKTILRRTRRGVCSRWLEDVISPQITNNENNDNNNKYPQIIVSLHNNNLFKSTPIQFSNGSSPLILIATGTGIAPIRSLIQYYDSLVTSSSFSGDINNNKFPEIHLFFGCRNSKLDFHYKNEWLFKYLKKYTNLRLYVAFSRENENEKEENKEENVVDDDDDDIFIKTLIKQNRYQIMKGVHIQKLLSSTKSTNNNNNALSTTKTSSSSLSNLIINHNAIIYICGSSGKFPIETRSTFIEILETYYSNNKNIDNDNNNKNNDNDNDFKIQSENYIKLMEQQGRFIQETW